MYKIAICDDDIRMCEQIERILVGSDLKNMISVEIFYTCEKLHRTLLDGEPFDLIFLDIEFKSMDGVSMGNIIRGELKNDYVQINVINLMTLHLKVSLCLLRQGYTAYWDQTGQANQR